MAKLTLDLGKRSYDILIGENLFDKIPAHIPLKKTFIVTDKNVAAKHLKKLEAVLKKAGIAYKTKILSAGEQTKSFKNLQDVCEFLLKNKVERKTTIIALGGGVIGDLSGFAASIVLRGINFIQVPTTLLSQVDSSVGGKTAVNSAHGKNLVGSFYQPKLVVADTSTLKTLPKREFLSGYAEVVKYGLINRPDFFAWLDKNDIRKNIEKVVYESCKSKAEIVSQDEREGDVRALLNLGHTFGHAFEAETGYSSKLLHGEAVALGMVCAFKFSHQLGLCPKGDVEKVIAHFKKVGLPIDPRKYLKKWDVKKLISHMKSDKKVKDGKMVFILAKGIGKSFIADNIKETELKKFLNTYDA
jgi:3-dehydroquinate synthase